MRLYRNPLSGDSFACPERKILKRTPVNMDKKGASFQGYPRSLDNGYLIVNMRSYVVSENEYNRNALTG